MCRSCNSTFSTPLAGLSKYSNTSDQTIQMICNDFSKPMTFSQIAERYGLSTARVIHLFDENIPYVPRLKLPSVLCIDEIHFAEEYNQKYCCVLYGFKNREIVDIIKNRQLSYLNEYFEKIPLKERLNVKYFISDMYDAYASICRRYFPNAIHIVDLFHVISQLTNAVNRLRVSTMNSLNKTDFGYNFMKSHWKEFLCRSERICDKTYTFKSANYSCHYDAMVDYCIKLDKDLLTGYNILQDLYHYSYLDSFSDACDFISHISSRLLQSGNPILMSVGRTYTKWSVEIATGLDPIQNKSRYTNAIAESINNHLKTIIKSAYGYHNFDRFRRRAMLILSYKKT